MVKNRGKPHHILGSWDPHRLPSLQGFPPGFQAWGAFRIHHFHLVTLLRARHLDDGGHLPKRERNGSRETAIAQMCRNKYWYIYIYYIYIVRLYIYNIHICVKRGPLSIEKQPPNTCGLYRSQLQRGIRLVSVLKNHGGLYNYHLVI